MADDGLVLVLAGLEETPALRPAFVESLRAQLHRELGFAPSGMVPAGVRSVAERPTLPVPARVVGPRLSRVRRFLDSLWPVTPRVVLLAIAALVVLGCAAAAAYLVAQTWLSSGPRGAQYTNDFTFAEVVREPGAFYSDMKVAADGRSILALRQPIAVAPDKLDQGEAVIVRWDLDGTLPLSPTVAFRLEALRDPRYWDAGTDVANAVVAGSPTGMAPGDQLSVASNGDMFVGIATWPDGRSDVVPTAGSLVVVHPDGSAQKIVTVHELSAAGLLEHPEETGWITAVASAPDRLWARAETPAPGGAAFSLFEIIDPGADGDWSDRVVRPLVLPSTVPQVGYDTYERLYGAFVAEPTVAGADRSRSVLLPVHEQTGEYRVFRISDLDDDGDASGPGEAELVFEGLASRGLDQPILAPRLVLDGDSVALDELVAARFAVVTRISRLTSSGVVDIARGFESPVAGVVATADGAVYAATQKGSPPSSVFLVYRLTPVLAGMSPSPDSTLGAPAAVVPSPAARTVPPVPSPLGTARPAESPLVELGPVTDGVAQVAVWYMGNVSSSSATSEILGFGADGSGPRELVPGEHNQAFCQSADGTHVAYFADEEVPNEPSLYLAPTAGGPPTQIAETAREFLCPFPTEALVFVTDNAGMSRLTRHDLATGAETVLVEADPSGPFAYTSDGRRLAVSSGPAGQDLQVIDVVDRSTDTVTTVTGGSIRRARWSPDGTRLLYAVGPRNEQEPDVRGTYTIWVVDVPGGQPRRILAHEGNLRSLAWSGDGQRVSILWRDKGTSDEGFTGPLEVVDLADGARTTIIDDAIFGAWSPVEPDTLAYADLSALHVAEGAAAPRQIVPGTAWPAAGILPWMGWSPDGRYIGTADGASRVGVVDLAEGTFRILFQEGADSMVISSTWWR